MTTLFHILLSLLVLLYASVAHAAKPATETPIRIGLTPVFLDDQAAFDSDWRGYLERHLKRSVVFVQRGSYREIVDLLREGKLDFAWLCGYPYVLNKKYFRLVAVPIYQGEPLYRSYLIVPISDQQTRLLADLRGKIFAFSDPDSNSGHLYTEYLLAKQDETPSTFFSRTFFTWSHRKVVEAVASGLAQGGSVDGYVWDTLALSHWELTSKTRIVKKSPQFGYPPFVTSASTADWEISAMQRVLLHMAHDTEGSRLLRSLNLDGFARGENRLYDGIAEMSRLVGKRNNEVPQRP